MTNEQFDALVARLETQAQRHPFLYKSRVLLMALLGYGYITVMLVGLVMATLLSLLFLKVLGLKLAIPLLVLIWAVLKALWVRLDAPLGRRVTQREAPALFEMINDLRKRLKAPRFHRILITDDFNACVVQTPRLGIFGWHRNYLVIGLPLMKSLSEEQFRAVLAHEFGHLAGGHGRVSNWIYRLRLSWHRLMDSLTAGGHFGTFLFRRFFTWYVPYFTAFSFPLARANEYEADAAAARVTSSQAMAQALTAVNVVGSYLDERYWSTIHRSAMDLPRPAFAPFERLAEQLSADIEPASTQLWLDHALERKTTSADTHPSLSDRSHALQQPPLLVLPAREERADLLLGPALQSITQELDCQWEEAILPAWQQRYETATQGRARLQELEACMTEGAALSAPEAYERACLTEEFGSGAEAALEQFRELQQQEPNSPMACFALGSRLLGRDDEAGLDLVQHAIELDDDAMLPGYELLRDFCWRHGQEAAAHAWHDKLMQRSELLQRARAEREQLTVKDKFDHHGLPEELVAEVRACLKSIRGVRKVYLLRKRLKLFPEQPLYVVGFSCTPLWGFYRRKREAGIGQRIVDELKLPGEIFCLSIDGDNYRFGRKFRWRRGARVV